MAPRKNASSTIHLLRHAHSTANEKGILAGQKPGIHLSKDGIKESEEIVDSLRKLEISSISLSPLERCRQTVEAFSSSEKSIPISLEVRLIEMHYGDWSGKKLSSLSRQGLWKEIQSHPSTVRFPNGESFLELQHRAISFVEEMRTRPGNHLLVTHGDVVKIILNHYLGAHLDQFQRIAIAPASLSTINFHADNIVVSGINVSLRSAFSNNHAMKAVLGGGAARR